MRFIDLIAQTLILIYGALLLVFMHADQSWPIGPILMTQLVLGPWQMTSSVISVIARTNFHKAKRWHCIGASIYLVILYLIFNTALFQFEQVNGTFMLTIPAWTFALYYYVITWKGALPGKRHGGSFLPHLSF